MQIAKPRHYAVILDPANGLGVIKPGIILSGTLSRPEQCKYQSQQQRCDPPQLRPFPLTAGKKRPSLFVSDPSVCPDRRDDDSNQPQNGAGDTRHLVEQAEKLCKYIQKNNARNDINIGPSHLLQAVFVDTVRDRLAKEKRRPADDHPGKKHRQHPYCSSLSSPRHTSVSMIYLGLCLVSK